MIEVLLDLYDNEGIINHFTATQTSPLYVKKISEWASYIAIVTNFLVHVFLYLN